MKSDNNIRFVAVSLMVVVAVVLAAAPQALQAITSQSPAGNGDYFSYLPSIFRPVPRGLYGMVTDDGDPAAGVTVELRWYDGSSYTVRDTTVTDADGNYSFPDAPTLGSGEEYYINYANTSDSSRLYRWHTRYIYDFTAGTEIAAGDFDIANIELMTPPAGGTVALPYTFGWGRRPATPTDSYEFNLFDYYDFDPYFYTEPPLGYVSSYTLTGLPDGFQTNTEYAWDMWVYGPGGGSEGDWGISYWAYVVYFSSGEPDGVAQEGVSGRVRAADLLLPRTLDQ